MHRRNPPHSRSARRGVGLVDLLFGIAVLAVAAGGAGGYYFFWHRSRPQPRFELALQAIKDHDAKAVRAAAMRFENEPAYEAHYYYLLGMYRFLTASNDTELRDAAKDFELSIQLNDADTRALAFAARGDAMWYLGDHIEAERMAISALKEDHENTDAMRVLSAVYYSLGAYKQALQNLYAWGLADLEDIRPNRIIARIYADRGTEKGDLDEALLHYEECLKRVAAEMEKTPPKDDKKRLFYRDLQDELHLEVANAHLKMQEVETALAECEKCTFADDSPLLAEFLAVKAECLTRLARLDEAAPVVDQALAVMPSHRTALLLKAQFETDAGRESEALALLLKVVTQYPTDLDAHVRLKDLYARRGDEEKAKEELAKVDNLKALLQEQGDKNIRAGVEVENAQIRYELGEIALRLDQPELADSWFVAALTLDPKHPQARDSLARLRQAAAPPSKTSPTGLLRDE